MLKNILAVIAGITIGSVVNMGFIILGHNLIPLGEGFDPMNATNWELVHFIFPFLAHALGTLAGAFIAAKIAASRQFIFSISIGVFFLIGGVSMVFILPAPLWFILLDLIGAYLPMAWLGWSIAKSK